MNKQNMVISNFIYKGSAGPDAYHRKEYAEVTVTTGMWWWKKSRQAQVFKVGLFWMFLSNGEFTPGDQVEKLARADEARREFAEKTS